MVDWWYLTWEIMGREKIVTIETILRRKKKRKMDSLVNAIITTGGASSQWEGTTKVTTTRKQQAPLVWSSKGRNTNDGSWHRPPCPRGLLQLPEY